MKKEILKKKLSRPAAKAALVKALMLLYDLIAVNGAYYIAMVIRYYSMNAFIPDARRSLDIFMRVMPYNGVISVAVFYLFRLYNTMWEFGGLRDLNRVFFACVTNATLYVLVTLLFFGRMPTGIYLLGGAIQFVLVAMLRFSYKLYLMERNSLEARRKATVNTLIVGMDSLGQHSRRRVEETPCMKLTCIASTREVGENLYVNGVPVISGLENIEPMLEKKKVNCVILADEQLSAWDSRKLKVLCDGRGIEVLDYADFLQNEVLTDTTVVSPNASSSVRTISFSPPDITDSEINEVRRALRSGWITTGPRTKELERKLAAYCHTSRVVCLSSATAAEELNFRICGIGEGDEVIVPAYTYTASASAAIHCGAKVILVDSQKDSFEMDYDQVARAITERTKAVVAVDLGGILCDYDKLYAAVLSKRDLFRPKEGSDLGARIQQTLGRVLVFADCAHGLGAQRGGRMAGELADFTDFSFHAVKNFTTAEGGASTWRDIPGIDNEELYHQYMLFSLHGQSKDALAKSKAGAWEYDIIGPWYKCNMTDIQAAIGLKQLERYDGLIDRRHQIIARYDAMCDALGVGHLTHQGAQFRSSGHLYLTRIPGISEAQRQEIMDIMAQQGVATNVHYKPLPMMTAYKNLGWDIRDFPNAYDYYHNLITLPLHTRLSDRDVDYVIQCFTQAVKQVVKQEAAV